MDNRFDSENQNLRPLQTAAHASEELVNDFKSAYEDGDALLKDSINTQLISNPGHYLIHTQRTTGKHSSTLNCLTLIRSIYEEMETSALVATIDWFIKLIRN